MRKVLILVDVFYSINGGAERQIVELLKNIDKNEYKIYIACFSGYRRFFKQLETFGIKIIHLHIKRIYDFRGLRQGLKFARFLKDEKIDVLMTYHFGSDIWGSVFGKYARVPVIVSNRRDAGFWKNWAHVFSYKILDKLVSKIVVVSNDVREAVLKSERVGSEKIVVIHNGINLKRFNSQSSPSAMRDELGISRSSKVIACVGNLRSIKGHKYLIEAIKRIVGKFPEVCLLMIGGMGMKERQLKEMLKDQANKLGLENNIQFLGLRRDVPEILKSVDICVLPSLSEGLSNTLLEYMSAGKPIVATHVGGNPEVISDGITGLLVNPSDPEDLADKLLYFLKNPRECERFGSKARENVIERFSIEEMVQKYERLFSGLCKEKS
ncbi:MAG: glycosyltransferase [Candidatus Omnitrophica bacterium]|nr:glycosyltransferase [Candidatus Omnitrophota bacterium]